MENFFRLEHITKIFGSHRAVHDVSLNVNRGEVFSLLGPSGCGKTTMLRVAAGFEEAESGKVFLEGEDISNLPPNKRRINTVFQNYALFPHMSVWDNIAFGPRTAKLPESEVSSRVKKMLELIRLEEHAHKRPDQISGGQKQRVAIARALINKPSLLLLDEPLAALDLKLRQYMLLELDRIHDEVGITFIYVTHDQTEAMSLSDRIAVMNRGSIEQIGTPAEIYESPRTKFVAEFIGDTNFFEGRVLESGGEYCKIDLFGLGEFVFFNESRLSAGDGVSISMRPEKFRIYMDKPRDSEAAGLNFAKAKVVDIVYQGPQTNYWVECGSHRICVRQQHNRCYLDLRQPTWDDEVWIAFHKDDVSMLASSNSANSGES